MLEILPSPDTLVPQEGFGADAIVAMLGAALVVSIAALYVIKKFGTD